MNKDPVTELVRIKKRLSQCEQREAKAEGRMTELLKQAKEEFGCSTKKELEELIERLSCEVEEEEALLKKKMGELEEELKEYEDLL